MLHDNFKLILTWSDYTLNVAQIGFINFYPLKYDFKNKLITLFTQKIKIIEGAGKMILLNYQKFVDRGNN